MVKLIRDFIVVLATCNNEEARVTCKNEEDLVKNEGAKVFKTLYIDYSDTQGQVTP